MLCMQNWTLLDQSFLLHPGIKSAGSAGLFLMVSYAGLSDAAGVADISLAYHGFFSLSQA